MSSHESPIGPLDSIDVVGVRNDGCIDTVIVCPSPLDNSAAVLDALRRKIRFYLSEIGSDSFKEQCGNGPARIFVSCDHQVSNSAKQLVRELETEAAEQRVILVLGSPMA
jgi:hypothetical protein